MPTNPRATILERQGPWIVASMRRFWLKEKFDKQNCAPTIHQTLAEAFAKADAMACERHQGHFAVFECVGYIRLSKLKKKKAIGAQCEP